MQTLHHILEFSRYALLQSKGDKTIFHEQMHPALTSNWESAFGTIVWDRKMEAFGYWRRGNRS